MSGRTKDRNVVIFEQLRAGMKMQQVADHHGISKGRVAQLKKQHGWNLDGIAIRDSQYQKALVRSDLNIRDNMVMLQKYNLSLLQIFQEAVDGDTDAINRLTNLGVTNKVDALLKSLKETRESMRSYVGMSKDMMMMENTMQFKSKIIEAIKEVCSTGQVKQIISKLQKDELNKTIENEG